MERFCIIDKFNTYYDWKLILTEKELTPPEPKTKLIELDGVSGSLDLSESLSGEVVYKDRKFTASFWTDTGKYADRQKLLKQIISSVHGKKVKIIEPDNPDKYLYGRVIIDSYSNNKAYAEFSIEATCEPWRYSLEESERYSVVNGSPVDTVIINNGVKTLCPAVKVTGSVTLTADGVTTALTDGEYMITDLKLKSGANIITVDGKGAVIFTYREGDL